MKQPPYPTRTQTAELGVYTKSFLSKYPDEMSFQPVWSVRGVVTEGAKRDRRDRNGVEASLVLDQWPHTS